MPSTPSGAMNTTAATSAAAKLTSLATKTLSLLLERQRLHTTPSFSLSSSPSSLASKQQLAQIFKNLAQLRVGIRELEALHLGSQHAEAVMLLRSQYNRMREMLGGEGDVPSLDPVENLTQVLVPVSSPAVPSLSPPPRLAAVPNRQPDAMYSPYTDDPETGDEPGIMLQSQRHLMLSQDEHLNQLSHSVSRQHHLSLQINDELDVHAGLLEGLDADLDQSETRLRSARRRLDRVARGTKENCSIVTIALLILVLLILIIVFKT